MGKYCIARQSTRDNTGHGLFMLQTHTLRIRNNYCLSTGTLVTRTRLNVTFIRTRTLPVLFRLLRSVKFILLQETKFRSGRTLLVLTVKITNIMQLYRLIYYSLLALHVSGDIFAHYQEHLTVFTVSGSIHPGCCRLVSWMS